METNAHRYWGKTIASFMLVLFTMPLGHALMRVMEDTMTPSAVHHWAFAMGAVGLAIVIWGVFVKGDVKQTLMGLFGGLLFWTGWVEFLYAYFAARFGVHYDLVGSGIVQTTTEYVNGIGVTHEMLINGVNVNDIPAAELKAMRGSRPVVRYDTIKYLGDESTLFMAGLDWWPWTHLRLQANYISNNTFQTMLSVKF